MAQNMANHVNNWSWTFVQFYITSKSCNLINIFLAKHAKVKKNYSPAVAAAASVPSSSIFTYTFWMTLETFRGSPAVVMPEKLASSVKIWPRPIWKKNQLSFLPRLKQKQVRAYVGQILLEVEGRLDFKLGQWETNLYFGSPLQQIGQFSGCQLLLQAGQAVDLLGQNHQHPKVTLRHTERKSIYKTITKNT